MRPGRQGLSGGGAASRENELFLEDPENDVLVEPMLHAGAERFLQGSLLILSMNPMVTFRILEALNFYREYGPGRFMMSRIVP